jgi:hypothetical protein
MVPHNLALSYEIWGTMAFLLGFGTPPRWSRLPRLDELLIDQLTDGMQQELMPFLNARC